MDRLNQLDSWAERRRPGGSAKPSNRRPWYAVWALVGLALGIVQLTQGHWIEAGIVVLGNLAVIAVTSSSTGRNLVDFTDSDTNHPEAEPIFSKDEQNPGGF